MVNKELTEKEVKAKLRDSGSKHIDKYVMQIHNGILNNLMLEKRKSFSEDVSVPVRIITISPYMTQGELYVVSAEDRMYSVDAGAKTVRALC